MNHLTAVLALSLALLPGLSQAQVRKCTGADGKVTFSDFVCGSGTTKETSVSTGANALGSFGMKEDLNRVKSKEAVDSALAAQSGKCKFAFYTSGDALGKTLSADAKQECLSNIESKALGKSTTQEAYERWRDHHQMMTAKRGNAAARDKSFNCTPTGMGGVRCN